MHVHVGVLLQRKILAGEAKLIRMVAHPHIVRCLQVLETRRQQVGLWLAAQQQWAGSKMANSSSTASGSSRLMSQSCHVMQGCNFLQARQQLQCKSRCHALHARQEKLMWASSCLAHH